MSLLVAYSTDGEDKCQGDSPFGPESRVEYKEGMTFDEARIAFFDKVQADWHPTETPVNIEAFIVDDFGCDVTGFWIVDEKIYDIITNINADWGNDSAEYAGIRTMKSQIDKAATSELTR